MLRYCQAIASQKVKYTSVSLTKFWPLCYGSIMNWTTSRNSFKVAFHFISLSIVLCIHCPEILLKSEGVHRPCSFFRPEGRGQLKFHDHWDNRLLRARVLWGAYNTRNKERCVLRRFSIPLHSWPLSVQFNVLSITTTLVSDATIDKTLFNAVLQNSDH